MVINPKKYHFRVKYWKKMQHYHSISKTHSPSMSWYKFYFREYVQDPTIMKLTHEERCFLYEGVCAGRSYKAALSSPSRRASAYPL